MLGNNDCSLCLYPHASLFHTPCVPFGSTRLSKPRTAAQVHRSCIHPSLFVVDFICLSHSLCYTFFTHPLSHHPFPQCMYVAHAQSAIHASLCCTACVLLAPTPLLPSSSAFTPPSATKAYACLSCVSHVLRDLTSAYTSICRHPCTQAANTEQSLLTSFCCSNITKPQTGVQNPHIH